MRGVAAAILLFIINIIGLGVGPWAVGIVSDLLAPAYGNESLKWSLMLFTFVHLWVAFHYFMGGRHLPRDLGRARELT